MVAKIMGVMVVLYAAHDVKKTAISITSARGSKKWRGRLNLEKQKGKFRNIISREERKRRNAKGFDRRPLARRVLRYQGHPSRLI
jgi:hypothetical protein